MNVNYITNWYNNLYIKKFCAHLFKFVLVTFIYFFYMFKIAYYRLLFEVVMHYNILHSI